MSEKMKTEELRELDSHLAEHVMGRPITPHWECHKCLQNVSPNFVKFNETHDGCGGDCEWLEAPKYTTEPAAAMDVLKRCFEFYEPISLYRLLSDGAFSIKCNSNEITGCEETQVYAETLELAICLFSKKLFSK